MSPVTFKLLWLFVLLCLGSESFANNYIMNQACPMPTAEQLETALVKHEKVLRNYESYLLRRNMLHQPAASGNKFRYLSNHYDTVTSIEKQQCDPNFRKRSEINELSVCPWKWTVSHNPNRYPPTLLEAKCICDSCAGMKPDNFECVPVNKTIAIMRRDVTSLCSASNNGLSHSVYNWVPDIMQVRVACICVFKSKTFPIVD